MRILSEGVQNMNNVTSATTSVAGRGASSKASSEAESAAKRSISEKEVGVVLRVNFAGPNRGLVANETASGASSGTTSVASSHKGKRCTSNPIKDKNDINRVCEYFKAAGDYRMYAIFMVGINDMSKIFLRMSNSNLQSAANRSMMFMCRGWHPSYTGHFSFTGK